MQIPPIDEDDDPLDAIVAEFTDRLRHGENPDLDGYCREYPEFAEQIRALFPTLRFIEVAREEREFNSAPESFGLDLMGQRVERLGDFRLLREIGRGGMGIVFEAIQESLDRRVALKILGPRMFLDSQFVQRFQREAQTSARMHHTNIVPVFGAGCESGMHYLVMQLIPGQGLDQILRQMNRATFSVADDLRNGDASVHSSVSGVHFSAAIARSESRADVGNVATFDELGRPVELGALKNEEMGLRKSAPLSTSAANNSSDSFAEGDTASLAGDLISSSGRARWLNIAKVGIQVAEALEYANQQGVLHRDIKPSNLLLDNEGHVWVADFGLAKFSDSTDLTHSHDMLGTLRYLAPERLKGNCDARSDIYSLGITLYELITERSAFKDHDRALLIKLITDHELPSPKSLGIRLPGDLETIVLKAIAKNPSDRYSTAGEMATDLRKFVEDRPILARRSSWPEKLWRWARRNPRIALLVSSIAVLLMVITAGSLVAAKSLQAERDVAQRATDDAKLAHRTAADAEQRLSQKLVEAYFSEMQDAAASVKQGHRLRGLAAAKGILGIIPQDHMTSSQHDQLRDLLTQCLHHVDLQVEQRISLPGHPGSGHADDIDPTFQFIATSGVNNASTIRSLDGKQSNIVLLPPMPDTINTINRYFSPCGRWLYEFYVGGWGTHEFTIKTRIWDWKVETLTLDLNFGTPGPPCFHPDGVSFFCNYDDRIRVYDLTNQSVLRETQRDYRMRTIRISPDGLVLAIENEHRPVSLIDAKSLGLRSHLQLTTNHTAIGWNPFDSAVYLGFADGRVDRFSPYGDNRARRIALFEDVILDLNFSRQAQYCGVIIKDGTSQLLRTDSDQKLVQVKGSILRFAKDETHVAVQTGNEIGICSIEEAPMFASINEHLVSAEFSPDGRWLALSGGQGVILYSTNSPRLQANLGLYACGVCAWRPDGKELITFGKFSHVQRWPIKTLEGSDDITVGPPRYVSMNPILASIGADNSIPQHRGRHSAWNSDGTLLVYADNRHGRVWTVENDQPAELFSNFYAVIQVAISRDSKYIAATSESETVKIWNKETRGLVLELADFGCVKFSPNHDWMAVSSRSHVCLYHTKSWELIREWSTDVVNAFRANSLSFQSNGSLLAAEVSRQCVRLWDCQTGSVAANLTYRDLVDFPSLSFSPDGARLAVTRFDREVNIWNLSDLRAGLEANGLPSPELPIRCHLPKNACIQSIDRGTEIPASDGWWAGYKLLAHSESLKSNWRDAIHDIDAALVIAPTHPPQARSELCFLRGQYELKRGDLRAAHDNWQESYSLDPTNTAIAREIIRIELHGPGELRNAERAANKLLPIVATNERTVEDQLSLGLSLIRLGRCQAAIEELNQISNIPDASYEWLMKQYLMSIASKNLNQDEAAWTHFVTAEQEYESADQELIKRPELKELRDFVVGIVEK